MPGRTFHDPPHTIVIPWGHWLVKIEPQLLACLHKSHQWQTQDVWDHVMTLCGLMEHSPINFGGIVQVLLH